MKKYYLVFGGELVDLDKMEFRDIKKVDVVGMFDNWKSAYDVWKAYSQFHVDNAHMRYFLKLLTL